MGPKVRRRCELYSAQQVLLNKQQIWCGGAYLDCYHELNGRLFTATSSFIKPKSGCFTFHACLHWLFTICNYEILAKIIVCPTSPSVTRSVLSAVTPFNLGTIYSEKLVSKILRGSVDLCAEGTGPPVLSRLRFCADINLLIVPTS